MPHRTETSSQHWTALDDEHTMTLHNVNVKTNHPAKVSRARRTESSIFYFLLTVHLSIFFLVINQLYAQNFCFTISLFHASTCFEHHVLIIRRSKLYYTASGIVTSVGGRPMHNLCTGRPPIGVMISEAV